MINTDQVIEKPTFYQNIRAMFSQYDQVMMLNYFDIHNYEQVKAWANKFLLVIQPNSDPAMAAQGWSMLQQVHIMPEVGGPWPDTWVQTFKNWIDTGCPAGVVPAQTIAPVPDQSLQQFIALSKALTGIDDFGPNVQTLATIYYNRLLKRPVDQHNNTLTGVLIAWTKEKDIKKLSADYTICSDIVLIWYNTTTNWDENGNKVPMPYYGTPEFNQYKEGLVWKVSLCHPMGYAPENSVAYWSTQPGSDGQYTGLYTKNY